MKIIIICLLLILGAVAEDTCTQPESNPVLVFRRNDPAVKCTATGKYDEYWNPCKTRFPTVRCEGHSSPQHPGKRLWECRFKQVEGYNVKTAVLEDHQTLEVSMTPHFDIHPIPYGICMICLFALLIMACLSGQSGPASVFVLGAYAWNDCNDTETCWNVS